MAASLGLLAWPLMYRVPRWRATRVSMAGRRLDIRGRTPVLLLPEWVDLLRRGNLSMADGPVRNEAAAHFDAGSLKVLVIDDQSRARNWVRTVLATAGV